MLDGFVCFSPACLAGVALINHVFGPEKTIRANNAVAQTAFYLSDKLGVTCPNASHCDQIATWLQRVAAHLPGVACLETACVMQTWLALHATGSEVVIGHCVEHNELLMHAWVETPERRYFYAPKFSANWRSASRVDVSTPTSKAGT